MDYEVDFAEAAGYAHASMHLTMSLMAALVAKNQLTLSEAQSVVTDATLKLADIDARLIECGAAEIATAALKGLSGVYLRRTN
jgi:hypothetical protein